MDRSAFLRSIVGVEVALLLALLGAILGHAALIRARERWVEPRLRRARRALVHALDAEAAPDFADLRALPLRMRIDLFLELARAVSGAHHTRLGRFAREAGLLEDAERAARSRFGLRRLQSARLLCALAPEHPALELLISDPLPLVRAQAAEAASLAPTQEAARRLTMLFLDPESVCRFAATDSLLRMGQCAVAPLAEFLLQHEGSAVLPALEVARGLADPRLLPALERHGRAASADVRAATARAFGALGGTQSFETLLFMLADPAETVRAAAACALGGLRHWPAAVPLSQLLEDRSYNVRRESALALVKIGAPGVLLLKRATSEASPFAADMARHVLDTAQLQPVR